MVIFSSTLLSSFSLSEIYSFLKYLHYRQRQAVVTVKIYNPGLDCLGATHFLTLCDPCWGRDPYFGNPWTSEYYTISTGFDAITIQTTDMPQRKETVSESRKNARTRKYNRLKQHFEV